MIIAPKIFQFRKKLWRLPEADRPAFLEKLPVKNKNELAYTGFYRLRDDQVIPNETEARYVFVCAGRGMGKTRIGATYMQYMVEHVYPGTRGKLAIVAPTHKDISQTILDEFNKLYPEGQGPEYIENKNEYRFKNGTVVYTNSSDQPLRGGNFAFVWCDEMVAWCDGLGAKIEDKFSVLDFACREGNAMFLITTTPKPFKIFKEWQKAAREKDPDVIMMTGSTHSNPHLSAKAKKALEKRYAGGRFGKQELEGKIVEDNPFALWTEEDFNNGRIDKSSDEVLQNLIRTVVAVDPAVTSHEDSDLTGIVVAGLGEDRRHSYVLKDATMKGSPGMWAKKAIDLYYAYEAECIVAETNNGGDLVQFTIQSIDPRVKVKQVKAFKSKADRASPIAELYKKIKNGQPDPWVHHVGKFPDLEDQCISYMPDSRGKSPDRLDALVWALFELYWGAGNNHSTVDFRYALPF